MCTFRIHIQKNPHQVLTFSNFFKKQFYYVKNDLKTIDFVHFSVKIAFLSLLPYPKPELQFFVYLHHHWDCFLYAK